MNCKHFDKTVTEIINESVLSDFDVDHEGEKMRAKALQEKVEKELSVVARTGLIL